MEWFRSQLARFTAEEWSAIGVLVTIAIFILGILWGAWKLWRNRERPPPPFESSAPVTSTGGMIGRDDKLAELSQVFASKGANAQITGAAVRGQGGLGKTTLARVFYNHPDHGGQYGAKLWIKADTVENALGDLLAKGCPAFDVAVPEQASLTQAQAIKTRIDTDSRKWLVVFDNVDKPPSDDSGEAKDARRAFDEIKSLIPRGDHVDVILTTREALGFADFETVDLQVLSEEASVELLLREAGKEDVSDEERAEALELGNELGGLPLALEMAGQLIKTHGQSFAFYRENLIEVLKTRPGDAEDYPDSVYGAVMLSFERLPPEGQEVLKLCAWWAAEGLTPELITEAPSGWLWNEAETGATLPEDIRAFAQDAAKAREGFAAGAAQSLLTQGEGGYGLHRAAAASLRAGPAAESGAAAASLLAARYPYDSDFTANWPACRSLTPHVRALWETGAAPETAALDYLLNQSGGFLTTQGDTSGAVVFFRGSLTIQEARLGEEDRDIPVALGNLAQQLVKIGEGEEARDMITRAVRLNEEHRPETDDLAVSYMQAAVILTRLGQDGEAGAFDTAEARIAQAMEINAKLFGEESEPMAPCWNQLGYLKRAQGELLKAAAHYEKATDIRRVTAPGDARLATSATNTGSTYLEAGAAARGELLLLEALEIDRAAFENDTANPSLRTTAGWLISCLLVLARDGDAVREAEARELAVEFRFEWAEREQFALFYYIKGLFARGDEAEIKRVLESDAEVREAVERMAHAEPGKTE